MHMRMFASAGIADCTTAEAAFLDDDAAVTHFTDAPDWTTAL